MVRKAMQKSKLQAKIKVDKKVAKKQQKYGLIAQLGERLVRIREVEGSNPFESTKQKCRCRGFSAHGIYTFGDLADKVIDQSEIRTHSSAGRSPPDF